MLKRYSTAQQNSVMEKTIHLKRKRKEMSLFSVICDTNENSERGVKFRKYIKQFTGNNRIAFFQKRQENWNPRSLKETGNAKILKYIAAIQTMH